MVWQAFARSQADAPPAENGHGKLVFRPLLGLGNAHVQTLLAHWWTGHVPSLNAEERVVPLADGDRLVLHDSISAGWQPGGRVAVLVHGLGGCHQSGPMQRLAGMLLPSGFRVIRVDL